MSRDENRSELGEHAVDAEDGCRAGGRAGQGVPCPQVRVGWLLGVHGHGVHCHYIPSGGNVQDGTEGGRGGGGQPATQSVRRGRAPGGGRVHNADHRPGQHQRADDHDRGKGVRHDQEKMAFVNQFQCYDVNVTVKYHSVTRLGIN